MIRYGFGLLLLGVTAYCQAPTPPEDAFTCPYPPASEIQPCECLADPTTLRIYLTCHWEMGMDNMADMEEFQRIMQRFDSYNQIYVLEMTCERCLNYEFDAMLNENTTGRLSVTYFTVERFDPSTDFQRGQQFSKNAFLGSENSLEYLYIDSNHYFTAAEDMLSGLTNVSQVKLHGLDSEDFPLPSFSSLKELRMLSLSNGSFPLLTGSMLTGLDQLTLLFIDSSGVNVIEAGTFSSLMSLSQLSLSRNNMTSIAAATFRNLSSLSILNLDANHIKDIEDNFEGVSANVQILLRNNNISQLPELTWRPLVERMLFTPFSEGFIDLENNPLDCGCDVKWLIVDLKGAKVFKNARCYHGENLEDVDPDILEFFCPN